MKTYLALPAAACVILSAACDSKKSGDASASATKAEAKAPDGYVLATADHLPAVGTTLTRETDMHMENATVKVSAMGQTMDGSATQSTKSKETMEVLSKDKLRLTIVSKVNGGKMKMNGQEQDSASPPDPMVGIPIILERSGKSWTAKLESGAAPTTAQQAALDKAAKEQAREISGAMYGSEPHKPGDKWTVKPEDMTGFGESEENTGTCTMEFVKVEDYEGTPCAVLKSTFDLTGKVAGQAAEGPGMTLHFKAEATSHRSLADQVDLAADITGTMSVEGEPAPNISMHMEGPTKITQKITVKKP